MEVIQEGCTIGAVMAAAAFLPFSLILAFGALSVPAGFLVDRFTEKPVMIASFVSALLSALSIAVPSTYWVAAWDEGLLGGGCGWGRRLRARHSTLGSKYSIIATGHDRFTDRHCASFTVSGQRCSSFSQVQPQ